MSITISDTTPRVQYTAANTQTTFAVGFEFFTNADLKVFAGNTELTYAATPSSASQYSVAGAGVSGGGSITLGGASTNGVIYTIYRDMAVARSTDFPTSGAFQIGSLNTELDKVVAMIQQVERDLKFSPQAAATTSNTFGLTFPNLSANKILSVNSAGTALEFDQDITDVSTVAGIANDISAVSAIAADVAAVENIASNITTIAAKATEIGRLGTSDAVADMAILATNDVVTDMNTLGSAAIVEDMGILATSANVTAMGLLGTAAVVEDMGILGTSGNVTAMATVSTNIAGVNSFADRYRVASSDPSSALDEGDLVYNTNSNTVKYYNGSAWVAIAADTDKLASVSSNDTSPGYLNGKLLAGTGISFTENSDGGNETLTITNTGEDPTALAIALG